MGIYNITVRVLTQPYRGGRCGGGGLLIGESVSQSVTNFENRFSKHKSKPKEEDLH